MQIRRSIGTIMLVGAGMASTAAAQTSKSQAAPPPQSRGLTLSGCVARSDAGTDQFTLVDQTDKTTYRLSGASVREYVGKRVEVVGGVVNSKKLRVSGGLRPTPNVAAQAGAIDPSQAATAAAGGSGPGTGPAPTLEFRIRTIRPAQGSCVQ
jgi:hypothetical protein